jgi:hypothetical protein
MSDPFEVLFDGLRGQRPPTPFAPAAVVRRRGRQRANRQAVSIGVAVLVATGLGAGGVVTALGGSEEPVAPPPVLPAASTAAVPSPPTETARLPLLTAEDLPDIGWREDVSSLLEGQWLWSGAEPWCPEYRDEDFSSVRRRVNVDVVSWIREAVPLQRVDQLLELYEPGAAVANLEEVRALIELCSRRPSPGDQVAPTYYEIEDTGFAGDESLLVREEQYMFDENDDIVPAGEPRYVAVVRVGDAVTSIQLLNLPDDARTIAQRAAGRLG